MVPPTCGAKHVNEPINTSTKQKATSEIHTPDVIQRLTGIPPEGNVHPVLNNNEANVVVAAQATPGSLSDVMHATVHSRNIQKMPKQTIVNAVVHNHIFSKIKFVKKEEATLDYSLERGTACRVILDGCNCDLEIDQQKWWHVAKGWVSKCIQEIRSDVTTQMKKHFWCKCTYICGFF